MTVDEAMNEVKFVYESIMKDKNVSDDFRQRIMKNYDELMSRVKQIRAGEIADCVICGVEYNPASFPADGVFLCGKCREGLDKENG